MSAQSKYTIIPTQSVQEGCGLFIVKRMDARPALLKETSRTMFEHDVTSILDQHTRFSEGVENLCLGLGRREGSASNKHPSRDSCALHCRDAGKCARLAHILAKPRVQKCQVFR